MALAAATALLVGCANPWTDESSDAGDGGDAGPANDGGDASVADASADSASDAPSASDAGNEGGDAGDSLPHGIAPTVLLDGAQLAATRAQIVAGATPEQTAALHNLIKAADAALNAGTWSVTTKSSEFVAHGDPHEYTSWGPYWWPPDASPPGIAGTTATCPYVNHDGIRNPNVDKITDRHGLHASSEAIFELALAWYFTGHDAYADQAARVARAWYLDPATAMNPDMSYAQQHGPCGAGNAAGLIEASGGYLTDALDGLAILSLDTRPGGWTTADRAGIEAWMKKFLAWIAASPIGTGEQAALNNHGTWYDALVSSMQLFVGDTASAKALALAAKAKRIDAQIMADGTMPQELSRTTSWHYSNYNMAGLCRLAGVAAHVGVDLWTYESPSGGSLVKAIDFLLPTATTTNPPGPWATYKDITAPFDAVYQAESYYSIRAAALYAKDAKAMAVLAQSPVPVRVPGHYCSGQRFPTGSDFCAITAGAAPFEDLQSDDTPAVDMFPLVPTCRMPIN